jgi:type I restriction enzyme S subunit
MPDVVSAETNSSLTNSKVGWRTVRFGDVVRNVDTSVRNPLEQGIERFIGLEHLDPESLHIKRWGRVADGTSFTRKFASGQVLFGKRRAYQRKAAVADFEGICSGDILVFEPKTDDLLPELLPFIVQSDGFFDHALSTSAGSLSPRTKWSDMAKYEFVLPPKTEQGHIAEILGEVENLEKIYVRNFMDMLSLKESSRYQFFFKSFHSSNKNFLISDIASVRYGLGQPPSGGDPDVVMIRATNVSRGQIIEKDLLKIDSKAIPKSRRATLEEGEIIIVRSGAYVGDSAMISAKWAGSVAGYDLVVSPNKSLVFPEILAEFFVSDYVWEKLLKSKSVRSAQPHLNSTDVETISIKIPSLDQQEKLVEMFQKFDTAIEEQKKKKETLKKLKATLLRKLFSNQVP